jgi:hypothetical protein
LERGAIASLSQPQRLIPNDHVLARDLGGSRRLLEFQIFCGDFLLLQADGAQFCE